MSSLTPDISEQKKEGHNHELKIHEIINNLYFA
jgi:hypothetical protein